ncbi:amino acid permease [Pseudonocardia spinosispora]|uniref:amino acid permease n=1 Tax=Pseudonocardia spinosispora TaxID=103441 RepID=UPI0004073236|nr:amino acid permease [Pseudonocardia spinosispora]
MTTTSEHGTGELRRLLSTRQIVMLGLGSSISTGLFLGAGTNISVAGPGVIISFVAASLIAGAVAAALAEMCSVHPVRGSFGTISARYLGRPAGFAIRWMYWLAVVSAIGGEVVAAAIYLRYWWPAVPLWLAVVVLSVALAAVNMWNVGMFGYAESILSAIKVAAVVVFLVIGFLLIVIGLPGRPRTGVVNWTADGGFLPNGGLAVWLVMATVIFSFTGVELIGISSPEAVEPARSMRKAMRSVVLRLTLFYVGAIAVMVAVLPWRQVGQTHGLEQSPFVTMFAYAGIPAAASITNAVVLVAALSAANANLYAAARMLHSLAHDGFAPRALRATSRAGSPVACVGVSLAGLVAAGVLSGYAPDTAFLLLISLASFAVIAVWIGILVTLIAFRRAGAHETASLHLPGGRVSAAIAATALLSIYGTAFAVPEMAMACLVGVPFMVLLVAVYLLIRNRTVLEQPRAEQHEDHADGLPGGDRLA